MNESWDRQLDARLRQVTLPPGMIARLRDIAQTDPSLSELELALLSDDALDEQLVEVELPAGLIERVQHEVTVAAQDAEIDRQLRQVEVPRGLLRTLRSIPWQSQRHQWQKLAVAAALLLMVSAAYYGSLAAWLRSYDWTQPQLTWIDLDDGSLASDAALAPWDEESPTFLISPPPADSWEDAALAASMAVPRVVPDLLAPPAHGPWDEVREPFVLGIDPLQDMLVLRWGVLGSPSDAHDRLPPLEMPPRVRTGGVQPPLVRGYDRQFLFSEGVHPIVSPEAHAELRNISLPLTTSTDSFDRAWRQLVAGRLPDADEMHIADFLAAMEYPLPPTEPGKVGLRTAAGRSPFGDAGAQLLQVAVQAGPLEEQRRSPVHMVVALDVSASMNLGGRLLAAKRGILQLLEQMRDDDRLSLLLFSDRHNIEVVDAGRGDREAIRRLLTTLEGDGGTDLATAVQEGASLAMSAPAPMQRKLVVLTDGLAPLPPSTEQALREMLAALHKEGLEFSLVDLSGRPSRSEQLDEIVRAAEGKLHVPADLAQVPWLLVDTLAGRSSIIATDMTLRLTLDPQAVAAYRLVGHEPSRLAGLEPAILAADLRAGQVVTGLLEVWLKPNTHDDVGTAILEWRDPATGNVERRTQRISRIQFATSPLEAPLSLQAAAIAAETGEVLKNSPFTDSRGRGLAEVQAFARRANPRLEEHEGFQRFMRFVDAYERLRVDRLPPKSIQP